MTVRATVATAGDRGEWDRFLASRPEADILQLWAWGEAVRDAGAPAARAARELPERVIARAPDGTVRGVAQALIRPAAAGRSVIYVPRGPVWEREAADGPAILQALLAGLRDLARQHRAIVVKVDPRARIAADSKPEPEPREPADNSAADGERAAADAEHAPDADTNPADGEPAANEPLRTDATRVAAALSAAGLRRARFDLQAMTTRIIRIEADPAQRVAGWSSGARNLWRRSAREGTETSMSRTADPEALDAFTALLERTARDGGFRTRPPAFFAALARELAPSGGLHLAIARWQGQPIAGMFVAGVGDRAYYLYGAADRQAPSQANGAYAAMGAVLDALAGDSVAAFDLWGLAEPDDPASDPSWAGFSAFKRKFGGRPLRHPGTYDLVIDPIWWWIREARERLGLAR
ncbi:MAG TPA: GNAT family N-acetyltransferase [Candidatus Eisenbacteria bacterium]|nr:GNAT family N-acetyltransferase [Candidatus Eisenbacteria bacterium]